MTLPREIVPKKNVLGPELELDSWCSGWVCDEARGKLVCQVESPPRGGPSLAQPPLSSQVQISEPFPGYTTVKDAQSRAEVFDHTS